MVPRNEISERGVVGWGASVIAGVPVNSVTLEVSQELRALIWMGGAMLSICVMAIGARELAGHVPTGQILFVLSTLGLLIISALFAHKPSRRLFKIVRLKLHMLHNLFHFAG